MSLLESVASWLWGVLLDYRRVRVLMHKACFTNTSPPVWAYFINITNLSRSRDIEITHVWVDTVPPVAAIQAARLLPKRLKPDEVWETWVECDTVPANVPEPYELGRVRLSTGRVVKSSRNRNVPSQGSVPGGPAKRRGPA